MHYHSHDSARAAKIRGTVRNDSYHSARRLDWCRTNELEAGHTAKDTCGWLPPTSLNPNIFTWEAQTDLHDRRGDGVNSPPDIVPQAWR